MKKITSKLQESYRSDQLPELKNQNYTRMQRCRSTIPQKLQNPTIEIDSSLFESKQIVQDVVKKRRSNLQLDPTFVDSYLGEEPDHVNTQNQLSDLYLQLSRMAALDFDPILSDFGEDQQVIRQPIEIVVAKFSDSTIAVSDYDMMLMALSSMTQQIKLIQDESVPSIVKTLERIYQYFKSKTTDQPQLIQTLTEVSKQLDQQLMKTQKEKAETQHECESTSEKYEKLLKSYDIVINQLQKLQQTHQKYDSHINEYEQKLLSASTRIAFLEKEIQKGVAMNEDLRIRINRFQGTFKKQKSSYTILANRLQEVEKQYIQKSEQYTTAVFQFRDIQGRLNCTQKELEGSRDDLTDLTKLYNQLLGQLKLTQAQGSEEENKSQIQVSQSKVKMIPQVPSSTLLAFVSKYFKQFEATKYTLLTLQSLSDKELQAKDIAKEDLEIILKNLDNFLYQYQQNNQLIPQSGLTEDRDIQLFLKFSNDIMELTAKKVNQQKAAAQQKKIQSSEQQVVVYKKSNMQQQKVENQSDICEITDNPVDESRLEIIQQQVKEQNMQQDLIKQQSQGVIILKDAQEFRVTSQENFDTSIRQRVVYLRSSLEKQVCNNGIEVLMQTEVTGYEYGVQCNINVTEISQNEISNSQIKNVNQLLSQQAENQQSKTQQSNTQIAKLVESNNLVKQTIESRRTTSLYDKTEQHNQNNVRQLNDFNFSNAQHFPSDDVQFLIQQLDYQNLELPQLKNFAEILQGQIKDLMDNENQQNHVVQLQSFEQVENDIQEQSLIETGKKKSGISFVIKPQKQFQKESEVLKETGSVNGRQIEQSTKQIKKRKDKSSDQNHLVHNTKLNQNDNEQLRVRQELVKEKQWEQFNDVSQAHPLISIPLFSNDMANQNQQQFIVLEEHEPIDQMLLQSVDAYTQIDSICMTRNLFTQTDDFLPNDEKQQIQEISYLKSELQLLKQQRDVQFMKLQNEIIQQNTSEAFNQMLPEDQEKASEKQEAQEYTMQTQVQSELRSKSVSQLAKVNSQIAKVKVLNNSERQVAPRKEKAKSQSRSKNKPKVQYIDQAQDKIVRKVDVQIEPIIPRQIQQQTGYVSQSQEKHSQVPQNSGSLVKHVPAELVEHSLKFLQENVKSLPNIADFQTSLEGEQCIARVHPKKNISLDNLLYNNRKISDFLGSCHSVDAILWQSVVDPQTKCEQIDLKDPTSVQQEAEQSQQVEQLNTVCDLKMTEQLPVKQHVQELQPKLMSANAELVVSQVSIQKLNENLHADDNVVKDVNKAFVNNQKQYRINQQLQNVTASNVSQSQKVYSIDTFSQTDLSLVLNINQLDQKFQILEQLKQLQNLKKEVVNQQDFAMSALKVIEQKNKYLTVQCKQPLTKNIDLKEQKYQEVEQQRNLKNYNPKSVIQVAIENSNNETIKMAQQIVADYDQDKYPVLPVPELLQEVKAIQDSYLPQLKVVNLITQDQQQQLLKQVRQLLDTKNVQHIKDFQAIQITNSSINIPLCWKLDKFSRFYSNTFNIKNCACTDFKVSDFLINDIARCIKLNKYRISYHLNASLQKQLIQILPIVVKEASTFEQINEKFAEISIDMLEQHIFNQLLKECDEEIQMTKESLNIQIKSSKQSISFMPQIGNYIKFVNISAINEYYLNKKPLLIHQLELIEGAECYTRIIHEQNYLELNRPVLLKSKLWLLKMIRIIYYFVQFGSKSYIQVEKSNQSGIYITEDQKAMQDIYSVSASSKIDMFYLSQLLVMYVKQRYKQKQLQSQLITEIFVATVTYMYGDYEIFIFSRFLFHEVFEYATEDIFAIWLQFRQHFSLDLEKENADLIPISQVQRQSISQLTVEKQEVTGLVKALFYTWDESRQVQLSCIISGIVKYQSVPLYQLFPIVIQSYVTFRVAAIRLLRRVIDLLGCTDVNYYAFLSILMSLNIHPSEYTAISLFLQPLTVDSGERIISLKQLQNDLHLNKTNIEQIFIVNNLVRFIDVNVNTEQFLTSDLLQKQAVLQRSLFPKFISVTKLVLERISQIHPAYDKELRKLEQQYQLVYTAVQLNDLELAESSMKSFVQSVFQLIHSADPQSHINVVFLDKCLWVLERWMK